MSLQTILKRARPYLFSHNTIIMLKRPANSATPDMGVGADYCEYAGRLSASCVLSRQEQAELMFASTVVPSGNLLFVARVNQACAARGIADLSGSELTYLRAWRARLPEGSVYVHGLFTVPEFRNRGVAQGLISHICRRFHAKDIYAMVLLNKPNSMRAFLKCGFAQVLRIDVSFICFIPIVRCQNISVNYGR